MARRDLRSKRIYGAAALWVVVLLVVGLGQRWLRRSLEAAAAVPIALERPLSTLPLRLGPWSGVDMPLDERVAQRAANDDFVNRRYVDDESGRFVDLFLAYTATPSTMLGHKPDTCYPAIGWRLQDARVDAIRRLDGSSLKCLIHRFTREGSEHEGLVVLNYYVLQGRYTTEWTDFWGPKWRRPNTAGDPAFYVAQVQIVAPVMLATLFERTETNAKQFLGEAVDAIESLLPMTQLSAGSRTSQADLGRP